MIAKHPAAVKRTRLVDVAQVAGVSRPVVAAVLTGAGGNTRVSAATAQRVREVAKRLRFQPNLVARQLRGKRSGLLGVLIGAGNPQVNFDRVAALERLAFERGLRCLVGQFHHDAQNATAYADDLAARGVDGLLWIHQPFTAVLDAAALAPVVNAVYLDRGPHKTDPCVRIDYGGGIRAAVLHLAGHGRRRIAFALAGEGRTGDPYFARQAGYEAGLAAAGLAVDPSLIWFGDGQARPTADHLQDIHARLVERGRADAIVASNDIWAAGLIRHLLHRGLSVPGDVAIVGFDNLLLAELYDPAITTIDQNHDAFARAALDIVQRLIAGQEGPRSAVVMPRLIVRESA
jgi:DNA-binding LacI/PurR family transcriptional regulator